MGDKEAISRLKRRDIGGLEMLIERYQLEAIRAAYLVVHDRALAEDIVQGAFLKIYERIEQFDSRRRFAPWFLHIVVNDALTAAVRRDRCVSIEESAADTATENALLIDPTPELSEIVAAAETNRAIWSTVNRLPPEQRAAIVLRYYLGLSEREIAAKLDCPQGTVKSRLFSAKERLKRLLPDWIRSSYQDREQIHVGPAPASAADKEGVEQ